MKFRILNTDRQDEWNALIKRLPPAQQDIYFTPQYYRLFETLRAGRAHCFVFESDQNDLALYPFLLNSVNDLGYDLDALYFDIQGAYGYNGVVSSSMNPSFINSFHEAFLNYCENENIIAEFTRFCPIKKNHKFSEKYMNCFFDRHTVSVDLKKDYSLIKRDYQRSTRKQIARMQRNPEIKIEYTSNCNLSQVEEVYAIYLESMERLGAKIDLIFSLDFFRDMLNMESAHLIIFKLRGRSVSFITFLHFADKLHGFLGGTLNEFLTLSPFSLLYDEMIRFGTENNAEYLHVGGGTSNKIDDKLLNYKLHFSQNKNDFYIGKKIHNPVVYEEVIKQWEGKFATKEQLRDNQLLKYRNINV
ncbi:MAG: GNAT family N-acetyltransferase [Brumimicrobium sp.]|nr:GNAT family N-acetyltransferase [Brumimicrobium sp.]